MNLKLLKVLTGVLCLYSASTFSQIDLEDSRVFKIGYRLGYTGFNPAYVAMNPATNLPDKEYKARIYPSNLDIWFGKNSEHAFYDGNIGGMVYALADYTSYLFTGKKSTWIHEKVRGADKVFKQEAKKVARGYDFDLLDMRLAFGGRGFFVGGQFAWSSFGASSAGSFDLDSNQVYAMGGSYVSYGLGLHYNAEIAGLVMQNSISVDKLGSKKNKLEGFGIKFESIIHFGKDKGIYVAPYIRWRTLDKTITVHTITPGYSGNNVTTSTDHVIKLNSMAFGVRAGFYLAD